MIEFKMADKVKSEPTRFFWYPYLIDENVNVIGGEGGTGKTYFLSGLIASTTNMRVEGMAGTMKKCGTVLYLGGEDGNASMKERLEEVDADLSKVALVEKCFDCMSNDFNELLDVVAPDLVIFDALMSYFPDGLSENRYKDARKVMDYLRDIARSRHICIVTVIHPSKREDYKLLHRFTGSGGFIDAVRSATYIGFHPTDASLRVGIQPKNNCADTEPFIFQLDRELGFAWRGTDPDITISDIEKSVKLHNSNRSGLLKRYIGMISDLLKKYPMGIEATANEILEMYNKEIVKTNVDVRSFSSAINKPEIRNELERVNIVLINGKRTGNRQRYNIYYKR